MRTIFVNKLPIFKQILNQNKVECPETLLYPLIKMKIDQIYSKFEDYVKEMKEMDPVLNTAKVNL
jgi:hypothetical protein